MNTNELNDLSQKLTAHARSQAIAWLEGEAAIGGTVDDEIVEFLARQDVPWERLTVEQQDGLRDAYLEIWKMTCSERLAKSDSVASPVSSGEVVVVDSELVKVAREALETIAGWDLPKTGRFWEDKSEMSYGACFGSNGERDYMKNVAWNALSRLRSLLLQPPLGGPEGLHPLQGASLSPGTDVLPVGGRTPQEWLEKYLDTDNAWLLDGYYNDQVVNRVLNHCAHLGKSVPLMYQFLAQNLLIAYKEWLYRGMKMSALSPTVPVQPPVGQ